MAQVTITINFRDYPIACDDGQEARILKLARILDEKARQLTAGGGQINENMLLAMSGLLLADDLLEMQKQKDAPVQQAVETKIVEKTVEKIIEPDWGKIDDELSASINALSQNVLGFIKDIENL